MNPLNVVIKVYYGGEFDRDVKNYGGEFVETRDYYVNVIEFRYWYSFLHVLHQDIPFDFRQVWYFPIKPDSPAQLLEDDHNYYALIGKALVRSEPIKLYIEFRDFTDCISPSPSPASSSSSGDSFQEWNLRCF